MMDIQSEHYITGDTAFGVDRSGVIVLWNEAAEKSLGFPAHEALGQKCWKLLAGRDQHGNRHCCRRCPLMEMNIRHEPVHAFKSTFRTAAMQPMPFDVSWLTVIDDSGEEILLHICRPELPLENTVATQFPVPEPIQTNVRDDLGALSQREIEILTLLAEKVSTQNIADRMSISIRTVRTHIQHLMYKLRVHKRRDAIEVAKHLKLI